MLSNLALYFLFMLNCTNLYAMMISNGKKLIVNSSLSGFNYDVSILKNISGVDSVIQCAMLCHNENCGSFSFSSDAGICRTYGARFCNSENVTMGSGKIEYYEIDDNSVINGCEKPTDCIQILTLCRSNFSGIYTIYPETLSGGLDVYCDMEFGGGGWMVFQRRMDGSENFYRPWNDYKKGFGDICKEFWLGNDLLHNITRNGRFEMRVDMEDFEGNLAYATYKVFALGNETTNYTLTASGFQGNVGNSLAHHNGRPFSTWDVDNDAYAYNCAERYRSGWWHGSCHSSNLNGLYLSGITTIYAKGVVWNGWKGYYYSMKTVTMKVRPVL